MTGDRLSLRAGLRALLAAVLFAGTPALAQDGLPSDQLLSAASGDVVAMLVELERPATAFAELDALPTRFDAMVAHATSLYLDQDAVLAALTAANIDIEMKRKRARQINGVDQVIDYRFKYLMNGFVAWVDSDDLLALRQAPGVRAVYPIEPIEFTSNQAIDYSLGTADTIEARRQAVYGDTLEWLPVGSAGHPETPAAEAIDGFEGQGLNIAIIDSGLDWRHPMFGGQGLATATPQVSGAPASGNDNTRVVYYWSLSSAGNPTDDFGHGTLVGSNAAGMLVNGETEPLTGYGTGTTGEGVGPTPQSKTYFGTSPQARILSYKVCGPAPNCLGDTALAMEDAASPFVLVQSGDGGVSGVPKPVADIQNLSLGSTSGSNTTATSVMANNAVLAGSMIVTSAGNSGPGLGTIGAPGSATMAITVAASQDPGTIAAAGLLQAGTIDDPDAGAGPGEAAGGGPAPQTGDDANALAANTAERQGVKLFPAAGGGTLPLGALAAHYMYLNTAEPDNTVPPEVENRVALVNGTGAFANIANEVAAQNPAAILIITDTQSATAVAVAGEIPTFTIGTADAEYLRAVLFSDDDDNPPHASISELPMRVSKPVPLENFEPGMATFSSRGPNDHPTAGFRVIKPDVTAPGVSIEGAATPDGNEETALGLGSPTGYVAANGTSFSSPITAGATVLVRQYVREVLGEDTTDLEDPDYRAKRFRASILTKAMLQNAATNLRSGLGTPEGDGDQSTASINDMGSGHINVAQAVAGKAIMTAPTLLLADTDPATDGAQPEFAPPEGVEVDDNGNLEVMLPTSAFGAVESVGVQNIITRTQRVRIEDVTNGEGAGSYTLSVADNRGTDSSAVTIRLLDVDSRQPIGSVNVPAGGFAEFIVELQLDGVQLLIPDQDIQWYVNAVHGSTNELLRMPFSVRVVPPAGNIVAPDQDAVANVDDTDPESGCALDADGDFDLAWTYTPPTDGEAPLGFTVEEATRNDPLFLDDASEPLVAGANSNWTGTEQWVTNADPNSAAPAYHVPAAVEQIETLTLAEPLAVPAGSASLSFDTTQDIESDFDFGYLDVSTDGGSSWTQLATYTGAFTGSRTVDLTGFAGQDVLLRFRYVSDLLNPSAYLGWYVNNIKVSSDNFRTISEPGPDVTTQTISKSESQVFFYRIRGVFEAADGRFAGPASNVTCVAANGAEPPTGEPGTPNTNPGGGSSGGSGGAWPLTGLLGLAVAAVWRRRRMAAQPQ